MNKFVAAGFLAISLGSFVQLSSQMDASAKDYAKADYYRVSKTGYAALSENDAKALVDAVKNSDMTSMADLMGNEKILQVSKGTEGRFIGKISYKGQWIINMITTSPPAAAGGVIWIPAGYVTKKK